MSQVYELFRKDIPAVKQPRLEGGDVNAESDDDLLDSHYRHNHPTRRQQPAGAKRRQHDSNKMSIGQLVASDALQLQQKRKKRKSKEGEVEEAVDDDDMARGMQLDKENNIRETLRMNRSAHKKRMQVSGICNYMHNMHWQSVVRAEAVVYNNDLFFYVEAAREG